MSREELWSKEQRFLLFRGDQTLVTGVAMVPCSVPGLHGARCAAAETFSFANPLKICVSQSKTPSLEVPSSVSWFLVLFGFATEKSPTPLSKNEFYNLLSRTYSFYLLLESLSLFFDFSQYRTRLCQFISRVLSILPPQYSFRTSGLVRIPPASTPLPLSARISN